MADEEILTSLKNAIERNEDLEDASQTLINAGYSQQEVEEAKQELQKGVLSAEVAKENFVEREIAEAAETSEIQNKPSFFSSLTDKIKGIFSKKEKEEAETQMQEKEPKNKLLIWTIIGLIALVILLILLIIFRDSIINLFS